MATRRSVPVVVGDEACCAPLLVEALDEEQAVMLAGQFAALSDPVRLRLLSLIANAGEVCSCDLQQPLGKSQPTVSHHTKILQDAGLIAGEKRPVGLVAGGSRAARTTPGHPALRRLISPRRPQMNDVRGRPRGQPSPSSDSSRTRRLLALAIAIREVLRLLVHRVVVVRGVARVLAQRRLAQGTHDRGGVVGRTYRADDRSDLGFAVRVVPQRALRIDRGVVRLLLATVLAVLAVPATALPLRRRGTLLLRAPGWLVAAHAITSASSLSSASRGM